MRAIPCDWAFVFPGGVPGWVTFGMEVKDIRSRMVPICKAAEDGGNSLAELSLIGIIAYFEGFARYHFASCANICPKLLSRFSHARPETAVSLRDIADMDTMHGWIGFVLADGLAFTSPKDINSQFHDLLGVTPFSKDEAVIYDHLLHDRHQIVHSASVFTTKYLRARKERLLSGQDWAYMDSVVITADRVIQAADFLLAMAEKIVKITDVCLSDPTNWHSADEMALMEHHRSFFKWTPEAFGLETMEE